MNHNDRLTRLRYALDIKDADMVKIFHLGGVSLNKKEVQALMIKKSTSDEEVGTENEYELECSDEMFERFLNGFITFERGPKDGKEPELELNQANANNIFLKKVKIALSLTSDDILDILDDAGVEISKSELSAVLRKEGHRNYKPCGDRYIRNFLKGLAM
ncbi:DUF1456 family protein [Alkalibacterium iburiense]|uniref:DUF1456 family protein n=1 Tax=Alkalibacterium iburiense TaxID=290589 RepID=A0ABP3H0H4_9LACT